MATFPNPVNPSIATSRTVEARTLEAGFGDAYTQRAGDGINTIRDSWDVEWTCLDSTAYTEINSFLEARQGFESFEWTPPGESVEKKYICKMWNIAHLGNSKYRLNATFNQVFDLA
jgi:phage-related protein